MADADTILIIGAGQAGAVAAATLRELGHEGAITLVGQEAHAPYERPPLSGCAADGRCAWSHLRASRGLRTPAHHAADGHRVVRIDAGRRIARLADGRDLPTAAACWRPAGGRANCPCRAARPACITSASLDDAAALRAGLAPQTRVAVIGGGFLGLEVASTARALGPKSPSWKARRACWSACCPRHCRTGWPNAPATPAWTCAWRAHCRLRPPAASGRRRPAPGALSSLQDAGTVAADIVVAIGLTPEVSLAVQAGLALDPPTAASR